MRVIHQFPILIMPTFPSKALEIKGDPPIPYINKPEDIKLVVLTLIPINYE